MKLRGKVAVITGGTEGIGLATAKLFAKEGVYAFITGRRQKELDEALKAIGSNVSGVQGDVANLYDLDRFYETGSKVKSRIGIVFANVGEFVPCGAVTEGHFDKMFNINARGNSIHGAKGTAAPEGYLPTRVSATSARPTSPLTPNNLSSRCRGLACCIRP